MCVPITPHDLLASIGASGDLEELGGCVTRLSPEAGIEHEVYLPKLERIPDRLKHPFLVMHGLDPRIHADRRQIESAAWIAGSSPATTSGEVRFGRFVALWAPRNNGH